MLSFVVGFLRNRWVVAAALLAGTAAVVASESLLVWQLASGGLASIAAYEWARLAGQVRGDSLVFAVLFVVLAAASDAFLWEDNADGRGLFFGVVVCVWVLILPWWVLGGRAFAGAGGLAWGMLALYAAWLAAAALYAENAVLLALAVGGVVVFDSACYFVGRAVGATPLATRISPKKTVEGLVGGLTAVLLGAGVFVAVWQIEVQWLPLVAAVAFCAAVLAMWGDLVESFMKRCKRVKDSGRLLGEHGGVLDRVDALLPVLPLAGLFVKWLV